MLNRFGIVFAAALLLIMIAPVWAQDSNLLQRAGFDDGYTGRGRADLNVPGAWGLWLADTPHDHEWQNRPDKVYAFPHTTSPERRNGAASLNLTGSYVTFTAALFQQVAVPQGANVEASAWAWVHSCNLARNDDLDIIGTWCGSAVESGAFTKIGIDPNGGTNPYDADIVWSPDAFPHDRYEQMYASATATGTVVTLFLFTTQSSPSDQNNAYWDDAYLGIGGSGGVAAPQSAAPVAGATLPPTAVPGTSATPAARATALMPVRQAAQPDGSIVHIVRAGDTIDGIALAYGVTRANILSLNTLANPRLIRIGDRIIVQRAS